MITGAIIAACVAAGHPEFPAQIASADARLAVLTSPDSQQGQELQLFAAAKLRVCGVDREAMRRFARMLLARRDLDVSRYAAFLLLDEYNAHGEYDQWDALARFLGGDAQLARHDPEAAEMIRDALARSHSPFALRKAP
jgi:hypothetical protein